MPRPQVGGRRRRARLALAAALAAPAGGWAATGRTWHQFALDAAQGLIRARTRAEYGADSATDGACGGKGGAAAAAPFTPLLTPLAMEWFLSEQQSLETPKTLDAFASMKAEAEAPVFNASCSCRSVPAPYETCCRRVVRGRLHKMGSVLALQVVRDLQRRYNADEATRFGYPRDWRDGSADEGDYDAAPTLDHREVLLLRNIYDSLMSGYLYHLSGRECWLDYNGKPRPGRLETMTGGYRYWPTVLNFTLPDDAPHEDGEMLCSFLARNTTSKELGMRVYIEVAFRGIYKRTFLEQLALTHRHATLRERSHIVCFEDFSSSNVTVARTAFTKAFDFLFPAEPGRLPAGTAVRDPGTAAAVSAASAHATSHDAALRAELRQIIQRLDCDHYSGQIAFMDRMVPCGHGR